MTLLNNLIKVGGSAVILKEIADRILDTRISREQTLRRDRAGMLALGVVIGSAAGAVAGVLLAPKSGKETREELSRYSCETWGKMKDNATATGHRLVDAVEEKGSRMRTAAEKGVDAARESLQESSGVNQDSNG
jgi:gas vesicle protein